MGSITINITDGVPNFHVELVPPVGNGWDFDELGIHTLADIPPGDYEIIVSDDLGCALSKKTARIVETTTTEIPPPTTTTSTTQPPTTTTEIPITTSTTTVAPPPETTTTTEEPTTTTTTTCVPETAGYCRQIFMGAYRSEPPVPFYFFYTSLAEACQAWYNVNSLFHVLYYGYDVCTDSFEIGHTLFATDCSNMWDGWYIYTGDRVVDGVTEYGMWIFRLENNILVEWGTCADWTTTTTSSTSTTSTTEPPVTTTTTTAPPPPPPTTTTSTTVAPPALNPNAYVWTATPVSCIPLVAYDIMSPTAIGIWSFIPDQPKENIEYIQIVSIATDPGLRMYQNGFDLIAGQVLYVNEAGEYSNGLIYMYREDYGVNMLQSVMVVNIKLRNVVAPYTGITITHKHMGCPVTTTTTTVPPPTTTTTSTTTPPPPPTTTTTTTELPLSLYFTQRSFSNALNCPEDLLPITRIALSPEWICSAWFQPDIDYRQLDYIEITSVSVPPMLRVTYNGSDIQVGDIIRANGELFTFEYGAMNITLLDYPYTEQTIQIKFKIKIFGYILTAEARANFPWSCL